MCAPCSGSLNDLPEFKRGDDPIFRIDFRHHSSAVGRFAQHELHELRARDECRQPPAAVAGRSKPAKDRPANRPRTILLRAIRRDRDQPMPPAFSNEHGAAASRTRRTRSRARAQARMTAAGRSGRAERRGPIGPAPSSPMPSHRRPRRTNRRWRYSASAPAGASALTRACPRCRRSARGLAAAEFAVDADFAAVERHGNAAAGKHASAEIGRSKLATRR